VLNLHAKHATVVKMMLDNLASQMSLFPIPMNFISLVAFDLVKLVVVHLLQCLYSISSSDDVP